MQRDLSSGSYSYRSVKFTQYKIPFVFKKSKQFYLGTDVSTVKFIVNTILI